MSSVAGSHFTLSNPSATHRVAGVLASMLCPSEGICLSGPLGVGKTEFVRGFCKAFGLDGQVSSPSYTLEQIYQSDSKSPEIHHWDVYRAEGALMIDECREILESNSGYLIVEWGDKAPQLFDMLSIQLLLTFADQTSADLSGSESKDQDLRKLEIRFLGPFSENKSRQELLLRGIHSALGAE